MSNNFSLLQQLSEEHQNPKEVSPFPPGVDYQEYLIEIDKKEKSVFIPLRECTAFEQTLSTLPKYPDREDLRTVLRKHRGIVV